MAKAVALIAFALGLLAISGNAQWYTSDITLKSPNKFDVNYTNAQGYVNKFSVEGDVGCATCKLNSETDAKFLGPRTKPTKMAKAVALIAFALGLLAISGNAQYTSDSTLKSPNKFDVNYTNAQGYVNKLSVEGDVLCATCKLNSETDADTLGQGELEIRCISRKNGTVTLIQPTIADNGGCWKTYVEDGHQDDLCMFQVGASRGALPGFDVVSKHLSDNYNY
ncbi:hypothetical protein C3L33_11732, partial [Rhododendron williamsianum]